MTERPVKLPLPPWIDSELAAGSRAVRDIVDSTPDMVEYRDGLIELKPATARLLIHSQTASRLLP